MNKRPTMPSDPVLVSELDRQADQPLMEELFYEIVSAPTPILPTESVPWRRSSRRPFILSAAAVLVLLAVVVPVALTANGGLSHATTTPFQAGRIFLPASKGSKPNMASGRWRLVSAVSAISGSWQQNTAGPPPGILTCTTTNTCFVLAGKFASAQASAPLSESLYVTNDLGLQWSVLPMPSGFTASTVLTCTGPSVCAAGGTLNAQPIMISTTDGGHQWTMTPMTNVSGELLQLNCSSATACHGIAGPSSLAYGQGLPRGEVPDEDFVTTDDGGSHWVSSPLPPDDVVGALACPDAVHCVVAGDVFDEAAFVRITTDGGTTWNGGTVPAGFTVSSYTNMSCADDEHCLVVGEIPITVTNPPQCASTPMPVPGGSRGSSTTTKPLSAAVESVAAPESRISTQANDRSAAANDGYSCGNGTQLVSDIASTSDGGRSWTPEPMPLNSPQPELDGIACASAMVCWASGSEAVPITVGGVSDGGSPMLLGTTDGGASWSKVTFSVPSGAPNAYGQSYLSIGDISCSTANACVALGLAAQSSATAPVYSFVQVPG
jgi:photosystem II stability/assembly factor-like uncharacterized protein